MNKPRILRTYSKLGDGKLSEKTTFVLTSMTGNASFATPDPTLAVIKTANDAFVLLLADAQKGDRFKIAKKNDAKLALIVQLDDLANYVTKTAKGNRTVLLSSGFDISKEETGRNISLGSVDNFKVSEGENVGELVSECSAVEGAKSYNHQVNMYDPTNPEGLWKSYPTTSASTTIKGLRSGTRYWCRIEAIGSNGQLSYSEPVSKIVQ